MWPPTVSQTGRVVAQSEQLQLPSRPTIYLWRPIVFWPLWVLFFIPLPLELLTFASSGERVNDHHRTGSWWWFDFPWTAIWLGRFVQAITGVNDDVAELAYRSPLSRPAVPSVSSPRLVYIDRRLIGLHPIFSTEVFFTHQTNARRLFHAPTFMKSLTLPPSHPQFPITPILHAICAISPIYTAAALLSHSRAGQSNFSEQKYFNSPNSQVVSSRRDIGSPNKVQSLLWSSRLCWQKRP